MGIQPLIPGNASLCWGVGSCHLSVQGNENQSAPGSVGIYLVEVKTLK